MEQESADKQASCNLLKRADLQQRLLAWATKAGFEIAPPHEYVRASALVAAARLATSSTDGDNYLAAQVLRALCAACNAKVARARPPPVLSDRGIFWSVTSSEFPSEPFFVPQAQPHRDKKESRKQQRLAKGAPEADPTRFRVLPKERHVVPHFTPLHG